MRPRAMISNAMNVDIKIDYFLAEIDLYYGRSARRNEYAVEREAIRFMKPTGCCQKAMIRTLERIPP
jgi:hypothetical protein